MIQNIDTVLPQVTSLTSGNTTLIEHPKTLKATAKEGEDEYCYGLTAVSIRTVTYLSQAGISICTCSGCGANFLMPGQEII